MASLLFSTKLYMPVPRPGIVPRPHLIQRLNAGLGCKLTLVSAGAGFGKTTLVSEWLAGLQRPAAWLSLDSHDNDPIRFLTYWIAALQKIHPSACQDTQMMLESGSYGPARQPVEQLLPCLINEIDEIPCEFVLVFDDYHVIEEACLHEALLTLVENQPPQLHLVLSSRSDPPWPLGRLRARLEINELRASDLRFTAQEAAEFLNQGMGLCLSPAEVAALDERTEGWVAGLQMAALSIQGRSDPGDFIAEFAGSHHFISDFLVEEVLARQSPETREFLLKTSILDRFCAPLCEAILDENREPKIENRNEEGQRFSYNGSRFSMAETILAYIRSSNLFLIPLDDEHRWFRYHHLFQDLLQAGLENQYPGEITELHRRASRWFSSAGLVEDAIAHALAARDYPGAAGLIEQAAAKLDMQNKLVAIAGWIAALPEGLVEQRPWLCVYRAWGSHWMGQRDQVERWLASAEKNLAASREEAQPEGEEQRHIEGHMAAIRSHSALVHGDIPAVIAHTRRALDLLPRGDEMRCETAVALGGAYWALGDGPASEQAFGLARTNALEGGQRTMAVPASCYMGIQQAKQGRLKEAMRTYQEALEYALSPGGKELPVAGFANIKIGDVLREWNRLEEAEPHLLRGAEQCVQLGQADVLTDAYVSLARLEIARDELDAAGETIARADRVARRTRIDPFVQCWLDDCKVRLWLRQNDLEAALRWARESGLRPDGELSYHSDLHHLNLARVMVAEISAGPGKDLKGLASLLDRLLCAAQHAGWIQEEIKVRILQARAQRAKRMDSAVETLARALHLAEPGQYIRLFLDEGEEMRLLVSDCRLLIGSPGPIELSYESPHQKLDGYIQMLLQSFPANGSGSSIFNLQSTIGNMESAIVSIENQKSKIENLLEPLTRRELEVLRLLAAGMTDLEIAAELVVAPSTAHTHVKNIYAKLGVGRRIEAVQRAKGLGLI
ncbi:MAG TPA: LuxR C-terminal-related transcriptional regulator [Anaerolineaceae bacterium]|nr:LuxR C-terminal-related transcriptional regulator [Anaerolineaceae bacterium]